MATGVFSEAKSSFGVAHGIEAQVLSSDDYAFVYSGVNQENIADRYTSHGPGTFSVNPAGGLSGFYVGEQSLCSLLSSSSSGSGTCEFNDDVKSALMECFDEVAWKDDDATKYRSLKKLLGLPLVESISIDPLAVREDSTVVANVSIVPDTIDISALSWWSDDETVATISAGIATGVAIGTTTIWAGKDGIKASCDVQVTESAVEYPVTITL